MISALFILLAAICNALMDRVENDIQFNQSVFKRLKKGFWCKTSSAERPLLKYTFYRIDGWHLSKSLMIVSLCLAIVTYKPIIIPTVDFLIFGGCWNVAFNIFYNKIFKLTNN